MRLRMDQRSSRYRTTLLDAAVAAIAAMAVYTCIASGASQVDACKVVDPASVNAAVSEWFGTPVKLQVSSATGPRGGTCDFATNNPKHIDFSIFYAPRANASLYGFSQRTPEGMVAVSHLGDSALFRQSSDPTDRYKSEDLAILKGTAVLDFNIALDKELPFVPKEKLAEFASKLVPKM